jgi:histidine triad (HIT) family protein
MDNVSDCAFCRIIAGEGPAYIIDENEGAIAFLSLENHPLVVPKTHIRDLCGMTAEAGAAVMALAARVARAMKAGLGCDGVYMTQSSDRAAGQDVWHFHVHLYPCWEGRELGAIGRFFHTVTAEVSWSVDARSEMLGRIQAGLDA